MFDPSDGAGDEEASAALESMADQLPHLVGMLSEVAHDDPDSTLGWCVQPYDWHHMRGQPNVARLMPGGPGFRNPRLRILGADMAGQVEAVGEDVTGFRPGDEVFAQLEHGAFAEYVCVREGELAPKPKNLSFEQAAAVPMAANTALLGLRD